jgi:hypothetical protein
MSELPRLSDLVSGAITDHGKATADILRRLDQDEKVDLVAESVKCLGGLAQTGARFFLFWDNIATLLAADGGGPLTFPAPPNCAEGETRDFVLAMPGVTSARISTGLRRRGEPSAEISARSIAVRVSQGNVEISVDCSGAPRGLYEGTLTVTGATTTGIGATGAGAGETSRTFNVYIDPKPVP